MTAINIISVGVNCPELTPPKASWQTEGTEETHSFHSLGWYMDIYSTGNQQEGITVLSILIVFAVKNIYFTLLHTFKEFAHFHTEKLYSSRKTALKYISTKKTNHLTSYCF